MTPNIYYSLYSLNKNLTLERNFYFHFSFSNYFCCSSYSLNLANTIQDLLNMVPVSYYLFHILHSILIFFERWLFFSKTNSALHYNESSYADLKHVGLIYKIQHIGITGNSLKVTESFLSNRFQQAVLNGQSSSWAPVCAGVPQGSIRTHFLSYLYKWP